MHFFFQMFFGFVFILSVTDRFGAKRTAKLTFRARTLESIVVPSWNILTLTFVPKPRAESTILNKYSRRQLLHERGPDELERGLMRTPNLTGSPEMHLVFTTWNSQQN